MADDRELGIKITAKSEADAGVAEAIQALQKLSEETAKTTFAFDKLGEKAQKQIAALQGISSSSFDAAKAIMQQGEAATTAYLKQEEGARRATEAIRAQTEALKAQAAVQAAIVQTPAQNIARTSGVSAERQINPARSSASILATSLSAAAYEDALRRDSEFNAKLLAQREAGAAAVAHRSAQDSIMLATGMTPELSQKATEDALRRDAEFNAKLLAQREAGAAAVAHRSAQDSIMLATGMTPELSQKATEDALRRDAEYTAHMQQQQERAREAREAGAGAVQHHSLQQNINSSLGITPELSVKATEDAIRRDNELTRAIAEARQEELKLNTAVKEISSAGFSKLTAELAGVKENLFSAKESADAFAEAMGRAGIAEATGSKLGSVRLPGERQNNGGGHGGGGHGSGGENSVIQVGLQKTVTVIDELSRGNRSAVISTLGSTMRNAGVGAMGLATGMAGLIAVIGTEAILHSAESMGKFAEAIEAGAAATGMSVQQYSILIGALQLTGAKSHEADAALRKFAESISEALRDPTAKAAQAFHAIGISQEELNSHSNDTVGLLQMVAGRLDVYANTATKAEAQNAIFGRSFEHIAPLLDKGADGFDHLTNEARDLGAELDEKTIKGLEDTGNKAEHLANSSVMEAKRAFIEWKPAIDGVIESLGILGSALGSLVSNFGKGLSIPINVLKGGDLIKEGDKGFDDDLDKGLKTAISEMFPAKKQKSPQETKEKPSTLFAQGDLDLGDLDKPGIAGKPAPYVKPIGEINPFATMANALTSDTKVPDAAKPVVPSMEKPDENNNASDFSKQIASAQLVAGNAAKTHKDAIRAEEVAAIAALQHILDTEKLNDAAREALEIKLINDKKALRNADLADADRVALEGARKAKSEQPTTHEDIAAKISAARQLAAAEAEANNLSSGAAGVAEQKAVVAAYKDVLANMQLNLKVKEQTNTEMQNATAILANKEIAESHRTAQAQIKDAIDVQKEKLKLIKESAENNENKSRVAQIGAEFSSIANPNKPKDNVAYAQGQSKQILADAQTCIAADNEVVASTTATIDAIKASGDASAAAAVEAKEAAEVRQAAELDVLRTVINAGTRMMEIYKETAAEEKRAKGTFETAFSSAFDSLGAGAEQFGDTLMKAVIAPKTELIRAGLTTIKVNLRGQELSDAARKIFFSVADSFVNSLTESLSKVAAQGLANQMGMQLAPGAGIGGLLSQSIFGGGSAADPNKYGITAENAASLGRSASNASNALAQGGSQAANTGALSASTSALGAFTSALGAATAAAGAQSGAGAAASGAGAASGVAGAGGDAMAATKTLSSTMSAGAADTKDAITTIGGDITDSQGSTSNSIIDTMIGQTVELLSGLLMVFLKPEAFGFSLAGGGVIPSAAGGMTVGGIGGSGPGTLAVLHAKEMVLPSHLSQGVQGIINSGQTGGGGKGTSVANMTYAPTINTGKNAMGKAEFGQMLSSHSGSMIGEARNMIRGGWRP